MELFLALCVYAQEPPKSLEQVPLVQPLQFSVTHDGSAGESIDGRVYIMLTKGKLPLIGGPNWFNAEPFYALDVVQWEAGTPLVLGEKADSMEPMTSLQNGEWKAVAVFRKQNDR